MDKQILLVVASLLVIGAVLLVADGMAEAQPPAEQAAAQAAQFAIEEIGLTQEDFPGYALVESEDTGVKRIEDFPESARQNLQEGGFGYAFNSMLQSYPLPTSGMANSSFRELQSSVLTFASEENAREAFENSLQALNESGKLTAANVGEGGAKYTVEYSSRAGQVLEQHYVIFLKGRRYALVSATALKVVGMSDALALQAAGKLAEKMT